MNRYDDRGSSLILLTPMARQGAGHLGEPGDIVDQPFKLEGRDILGGVLGSVVEHRDQLRGHQHGQVMSRAADEGGRLLVGQAAGQAAAVEKLPIHVPSA